MASNMDLITQELSTGTPRVTANALSAAIAVTDTDLLVAKAGWFSKKVQRYPLSSLTGVRLSPNPHTDLVSLQFAGSPGLTLMFGPDAKADVQKLVDVLQAQVEESRHVKQ